MNYVSQNILDGLSILSAGQLAVPDLLPRLSVIGSWSKGKVPRLERHRPVETIDSSCAPINSNWAGRFFPGVGPQPKGVSIPIRARLHKGKQGGRLQWKHDGPMCGHQKPKQATLLKRRSSFNKDCSRSSCSWCRTRRRL